MDWWMYFFPLLGYVFGAIPSAYVVGKLSAGVDIRQVGSGNVGTTNALRVLGRAAGAMVLVLDVCKILVVLWLARWVGLTYNLQLLTAAAAIIGHNWSIFIGFKGGKGVAVSTGMILWFYPLPALVAIFSFIIVVAISRYVSLGSVVAALCVPLVMVFLHDSAVDILYTTSLAMMLILRHSANIGRLLAGTENRFSLSKS